MVRIQHLDTVVGSVLGIFQIERIFSALGVGHDLGVALERFVGEIADTVKTSGVQRALEPMGPADRKIVHDTVNEIDGVRTTSEGEEPRRRVVILPD